MTPAWLDRPTILMVHGTPTWSFLYRHLVKGLGDRYRCVVPDHLGFGLSGRPAGWSYRPQDQARILAQVIDTLELKDLTLVVHDFGGPIRLAYAVAHPEKSAAWCCSTRGCGRYGGSAAGVVGGTRPSGAAASGWPRRWRLSNGFSQPESEVTT